MDATERDVSIFTDRVKLLYTRNGQWYGFVEDRSNGKGRFFHAKFLDKPKYKEEIRRWMWVRYHPGRNGRGPTAFGVAPVEFHGTITGINGNTVLIASMVFDQLRSVRWTLPYSQLQKPHCIGDKVAFHLISNDSYGDLAVNVRLIDPDQAEE